MMFRLLCRMMFRLFIFRPCKEDHRHSTRIMLHKMKIFHIIYFQKNSHKQLGFLYHGLEITKSIYQILQFFASEFDISKVVFSTSLRVANQSSPRLYLVSRRLGPRSLGWAYASLHRGTTVAAPAMPSRAWEGRTAAGAVWADRAGEACAPTTALLAHTGEGHVATHDVHTHTGEGAQLRPLCSLPLVPCGPRAQGRRAHPPPLCPPTRRRGAPLLPLCPPAPGRATLLAVAQPLRHFLYPPCSI
jgi:hypothetical protein